MHPQHLAKLNPDVSRILQIIDTGLDETSCFFVDDDGEEVQHGYYFDELSAAVVTATSVTDPHSIFSGGNFTYYPERRKVQEICLQRLGLDVRPQVSSGSSGIASTPYCRQSAQRKA